MKTYEGYLIDLDGTMYLGDQSIDEAAGFVARLRAAGKKFLFLTNNSTNTPGDVVKKLKHFGIKAYPEEVYSSSLATVTYLKKEGIESVYRIGEGGIADALSKTGIRETEESPDAVVVGLDRDVTYEDLKTATLLIREGARFINTNPDTNLPTGEGMLPGSGALAAFLQTSTQVEPTVIGKPSGIMLEAAIERLGIPAEKCLMVGDNYDTDIRFGLDNGLDTLMVFTGLTTQEELAKKEKMPTYQVATLDEWEINR